MNRIDTLSPGPSATASRRLPVPLSPLPKVALYSSTPPRFWLFSGPIDLGVFLGSALLALVALWIGARAGVLNERSPEWTWVPAVLLIDVAHVWGTGFRVYFNSKELKRRPWLYALVPVLGFVVCVTL